MKPSHNHTQTLKAFLHSPEKLPPALRLKESEDQSPNASVKKRPKHLGRSHGGQHRQNYLRATIGGHGLLQEPWRFNTMFEMAKRRVEKKEAAKRWAPGSTMRTGKSLPALTSISASASSTLHTTMGSSGIRLPPLGPGSKEPVLPKWKELEESPLVEISPRPLPTKPQYPLALSSDSTDAGMTSPSRREPKEAIASSKQAEDSDKNKAKQNAQTENSKKKIDETSESEPRSKPAMGRATLTGFKMAWAEVEDASGYKYSDAQELYMTFDHALLEGDNEVDKEQLPAVIKTLGHHLVDTDVIKKLADETTNYSTLNFEQFLKFVSQYASFERAEWQEHFNKFDVDKSGEVSVEELKLVLMDVGYTPLEEMLQEALQEVDSDGTGQISLDEFVQLLEHYKLTEGFTKEEYKEMQSLFTRFDRNKDGQIDRTELYYMKRFLGLKGSSGEEPEDMRPLSWKGFLAEMRRYTEAEIAFFKKEFEKFDEDKSGQISTDELIHILENMGFTPLKKMLDEVLVEVDKDGSGQLDFFEFVRLMWLYRRSGGFTKSEVAELQGVFDRYDADKSGEVSIMELGDILRYLGFVPKLTEVQKLVEEFDTDGSGDVGMTEFVKIMRRFRETEVQEFRQIFKRYDKDRSGSMQTHELASALRMQGHEVSMKIMDEVIEQVDTNGSGEVEWNEFVVLMDNYRRMAVKDKRRRCGFTDAEVVQYKMKWQTFDADGSDDLNTAEVTKLLGDLHMAPRSPQEQRKILLLLEECRTLAEEQDGKTTFWVFLRLMRFLEDDKDRGSLAIERKAIEESKFSKEEVSEFREIFYHWASAEARTSWKQQSNKSLAPESVHKMLRSMGMSMTGDDREQLFTMVKEVDQDGNGNVDFPDFLILMRRLLNANFCGLNEVAEAAASRKK